MDGRRTWCGLLAVLAVGASCGDSAPMGVRSRDHSAARVEYMVALELPHETDSLVGPTAGRVRTAKGEGWHASSSNRPGIIPDNFNYSESPATSTGAARTVTVVLPEGGTYLFELDAFVVSGSLCGTCERMMGGGGIEAQSRTTR